MIVLTIWVIPTLITKAHEHLEFSVCLNTLLHLNLRRDFEDFYSFLKTQILDSLYQNRKGGSVLYNDYLEIGISATGNDSYSYSVICLR